MKGDLRHDLTDGSDRDVERSGWIKVSNDHMSVDRHRIGVTDTVSVPGCQGHRVSVRQGWH